MMHIMMDLDLTAIDSTHRARYHADGSIDLTYWRVNSTREKIFQDTLLPVSETWRNLQMREDCHIIVCTARVISQDDIDYLAHHGLRYDVLLSRKEGDNTPDATLKVLALKQYAKSIGKSWAVFCATCFAYDDNDAILATLSKHNINTFDSKILNGKIA
jgi:hypothetical protein